MAESRIAPVCRSEHSETSTASLPDDLLVSKNNDLPAPTKKNKIKKITQGKCKVVPATPQFPVSSVLMQIVRRVLSVWPRHKFKQPFELWAVNYINVSPTFQLRRAIELAACKNKCGG